MIQVEDTLSMLLYMMRVHDDKDERDMTGVY